MKIMKKMLSVVLALSVIMAFSFTCFAADNTGITVSNAKAGETYSAYKIFDATQTGDNVAYTMDANSPFKTVIAGFEVKGEKAFTLTPSQADSSKLVVTFKDLTDADIKALAVAIKPVAKTVTADETVRANSNGVATFEKLGLGYYFVSTTTGALCALDTTNASVNIQEKNTYPDDSKKIVESDKTEVDATTRSIGDKVDYKLVITDGTGTDGKIILHDTMEKGLTLDEDSFAITVDEKDVAEDNYSIAFDSNGYTFEITFKAAYIASLEAGDEIEITYSAELNEDAEIVEKVDCSNDNKSFITYNADNTYKYETEPNIVEVRSFEFDLVKTDENKKVLSNAEFKLYDAETGGNEIALVKDGDNYRVATPEEKAADGFKAATMVVGKAAIEGLGNGTYWLEETKAPDGFNILTSRVAVEIEDASNPATVHLDNQVTIYDEGGVQVINKSGVELPSTGGIGTTIFYILGIILVVGAAVVLITRRRMDAR